MIDSDQQLPRFSIVIPSFNQGTFLRQSIESVLSQGYPNLELVIIDGGSTDNSVDVIREFESDIAYWVSEEDRGQSHAINKGFSRCSGDIFCWLNSDDYFLPGALQEVARAYQATPDAGAWVGSGIQKNVESGAEFLREVATLDPRELGEQWSHAYFCQPSCFFSSNAWKQCGPLDESLHLAMDTDLWFKMLAKFPFAHVDAVLSVAVIHPDAKTQAQANASKVMSWFVQAQHGFEDAARAEIEFVLRERDQFKAKYLQIASHPIYRGLRRICRLVKPKGGGSE